MLEWSFGHFWKAYVSDSSHRPPKLQIMLVASPRNQPYFHAEKLQVDLHQTAALKYKLESSPGRPKLSRPALSRELRTIRLSTRQDEGVLL